MSTSRGRLFFDLFSAFDKARAMGFDTLIMGMRDSEGLRSVFNIPSGEAVMAVISLGYRAGEPRIPAHRDLDEIVRFF